MAKYKTKTLAYQIGEITIKYVIEMWESEYGDCEVYVQSHRDIMNQALLCVISGAETQDFQQELENLINRYRI